MVVHVHRLKKCQGHGTKGYIRVPNERPRYMYINSNEKSNKSTLPYVLVSVCVVRKI